MTITFMPFDSYEKSARCLDKLRLINQLSEVISIFAAITQPQNHASGKWSGVAPIYHMWRGFENSLLHYGLAIAEEMRRREYVVPDVCRYLFAQLPPETRIPPFMGDKCFHDSHKAMLLFKNYPWYATAFFGSGYPLVREHMAPTPKYWWPLTQKNWTIVYANKYYRDAYKDVDFFHDKPWVIKAAQSTADTEVGR